MAGTAKLVGKNLEEALKMLPKVCSLLEANDIAYTLDAGTLLGVMRENRLLPWDTDMDIAVPAQHALKLKKLRKEIYKMGYLTRLRYTRIACGPVAAKAYRLLRVYTRKFLFFKREQLMDIFIKYKDGDKYYWVIGNDHPILQSCMAEHLDERIKQEFNGGTYFIPKDYDGYLSHHYGDWRVVKKDYDFREECGCNNEYF